MTSKLHSTNRVTNAEMSVSQDVYEEIRQHGECRNIGFALRVTFDRIESQEEITEASPGLTAFYGHLLREKIHGEIFLQAYD